MHTTNLMLTANSFLSRRGFSVSDFEIDYDAYNSKHKLLTELMKCIKNKKYVVKKKNYKDLPTYTWSNKNLSVTITCSIEELGDKYKINKKILTEIVNGDRKSHQYWKLAS